MPNWRAPVVALVVVVLLACLGLVAAFVALTDDSAPPAATTAAPPAATAAPPAAATTAPPATTTTP
jgi:eukaryotic-like serine/threonine-protein kinase